MKLGFPKLVDRKLAAKNRQLKGCRFVNGKLRSVFAGGMHNAMVQRTKQDAVDAISFIRWCGQYDRSSLLRIAMESQHQLTNHRGPAHPSPCLDIQDPR